ncbi:MAG: diguanylate cyclase [Janthinobacterium lividum]
MQKGRLLRLCGVTSDITPGTVADHLIGLHNRSSFLEHLRWRIRSGSKHHRAFALLFIDLDLFKQMNGRFRAPNR